RHHRPARPPPRPHLPRAPPALVCRLPRRATGVPRRAPARLLPGPAPRHGSHAGDRFHLGAPSAGPPTRLPERGRGGGPLSPPWPKSRRVAPRRARGASRAAAPPRPPAPLAARLLPPSTPPQPPTCPPGRRTFSLTS